MILRTNWPDLVKDYLFKYFNNEYSSIEKMVPFLFNIQKSELNREIMSSAGEYPDLSTFNGTVNYADMYEGYDKTFTHDEKAGGLQIRDTLLSDAKGAGHGYVFTERPEAMARAVSRTREKQGASIISDAFTSEPTDSDGTELCADDHPRPMDSETQSNEGTTALGPVGLEAARLAMRKFTDDQGDYCDCRMDTLLVSEDNHETGYEIINSTGKVNTANNNENFHYGRYKLSTWLRLEDTNDWFAIDSKAMKNSLFWFNREPIKFYKDSSSDTLSAKYIAYYRSSRGWRNWRFVYGMKVA